MPGPRQPVREPQGSGEALLWGYLWVGELSRSFPCTLRAQAKIHHGDTEITEKSTAYGGGRDHAFLFVAPQFFRRLLSVTSVSLW